MPTGTVTFLFTDIEGSTRLWEEHPAAMRAALATHDGILRSAVEDHGGQVVKTTGDGVHAAFAVAEDAVSAAVAAQGRLEEAVWGATGPLAVRMGLHTGAAEFRDGDYYGPALNRAARLMAAAHGGQVIVSQATADLMRDTSTEAGLLDLGEHRLRDLGRAEHVFQVTGSKVDRDFPPLRSLDAVPGNLPVQLTEFVGRDAELRAVRKLVEEARLVTLTGPGGVGKTRLALQVAAESIGSFRDGVWFVDLAPVDDPILVSATVMAALQIPEPRQGIVEDALLAALRRQQVLIVLDNCEHLVDAAASFVELVAHECADVAILATSREAFGLIGEDTFPLKPLAVPPADELDDLASLRGNDAVRLFVERAGSARHGFELSTENAAAVGELCRRLDGIPLAIELAAARVQTMSPADILDRLTERFRLLAHGRRSGLARHQTLRGAIDWSYELLTPAEQLMFDRCSVFSGGFVLDAAEAVVVGDGVDRLDVVDLVSSLVAKSMIVVEDAGGQARYRMLETLRDYAADRLAERGGTKVIRNAHTHHYLRLAEELGPRLAGPDPDPPREQVDAEYGNLRAALAWSEDVRDADTLTRLVQALQIYWHQRGLSREALGWVQSTRALNGEDAPLTLVAWLDAERGYLSAQLCRWDEAREWLHASLGLTRAAGEPPIVNVAGALSLEALETNRPDDAIAYARQALAAARERNEPYWEGFAAADLSVIVSLTQPDGEPALADQAIEIAQAHRNGYEIGHALIAVGIAWYRTEPEAAVAALDQAVQTSSRSLLPGTLLQAQFFRGLAHLRLRNTEQAAADLSAAIGQAHVIGNDYYVAMILTAAAGLLSRDETQQETAVRILAAADRLRDEAGLTGAPRDLAMQQRIADGLRETQGSRSFQRAWTVGRQARLEDVIGLTRSALDHIATT